MSDAQSNADSYHGNGQHILLVDHDVSMIETGKRIIEQLNYNVTTCVNSAKALCLIHSITDHPIDCVVCEISMPLIGGVAIANTCRLCRPGTSFLLSSETGDVLSPDSLSILGIAGIVMKPFSPHFLGKALNRALNGPGR